MSKAFPLQTLLDLSQIRLDDATRRLGELMAGERTASERLDLLSQYRLEYHGRFVAAAQAGLSQDQWRNFQAFLGKLDAAIGQAQAAVDQSRRHTAAGQQMWLDKRGEMKAFDTLSRRHHQRQQQVEAKQEQKAQDEHAARQLDGKVPD